MSKILGIITAAALCGSACGRHEHEKPKGPAAPTPTPAPLADATETPANEAAANFRGFFATQDLVKERLLTPASAADFYLGTYLDSQDNDFNRGLPELLGLDAGDGVRAEFRNGQANAINMVLWDLTMQSLARDAAQAACAPAGDPGATAPGANASAKPLAFAPELLAALTPLCASPTAELAPLWDTVMAADAPGDERQAFLDDLSADGPSHAVVGAGGQTAAAGALTVVLMNPHFLIRQ